MSGENSVLSKAGAERFRRGRASASSSAGSTPSVLRHSEECRQGTLRVDGAYQGGGVRGEVGRLTVAHCPVQAARDGGRRAGGLRRRRKRLSAAGGGGGAATV